MYSYKERMKAVKLLIQYDMCSADVRRELGYPSKEALRTWYEKYKKNGNLQKSYERKQKYSSEKNILQFVTSLIMENL